MDKTIRITKALYSLLREYQDLSKVSDRLPRCESLNDVLVELLPDCTEIEAELDAARAGAPPTA